MNRDERAILEIVLGYARGAVEYREFNWVFTPLSWGVESWADERLIRLVHAVILAKAGYVARHKTEAEVRTRLKELLEDYRAVVVETPQDRADYELLRGTPGV